jgi:hypothetical protein
MDAGRLRVLDRDGFLAAPLEAGILLAASG